MIAKSYSINSLAYLELEIYSGWVVERLMMGVESKLRDPDEHVTSMTVTWSCSSCHKVYCAFPT